MSKLSSPLVSIVIPVYNGANYVTEAINSALQQTYRQVEVIVVNDGSKDETDRIVSQFQPRIRYFKKKNGGVATALNLGLHEMRGEYVAWLSHDDVFYPDKIAKQVAKMQSLGQQAVLYSDYEFINEKGAFLCKRVLPHVAPSQVQKKLLTCHLIHGCTTLIPKSFFDEVGFFDESLHTAQDYDLWFRMAGRFDFVHMPEVLIKSRLHSQQGVNQRRELHKKECNAFYIQCFKTILEDTDSFSKVAEELSFFLQAALHAEKFDNDQAAEFAWNVVSKHNSRYFTSRFWLSKGFQYYYRFKKRMQSK